MNSFILLKRKCFSDYYFNDLFSYIGDSKDFVVKSDRHAFVTANMKLTDLDLEQAKVDLNIIFDMDQYKISKAMNELFTIYYELDEDNLLKNMYTFITFWAY